LETEVNEPRRSDPRAVWLRSLGWREVEHDRWTGPVIATRGGRYRPMTLEHAFEVALKRTVIDQSFRVEIAADGVRLATPWRDVAPEDRASPEADA
jgi:hypothetical protein